MSRRLDRATTQNALLERFLAAQRSRQILPFIRGKFVLDFGCGLEAWNANAIVDQCQLVYGVEANFSSPVTVGRVNVFPALDALPDVDFDVVIALAVFEHIPPFDLIRVLQALRSRCKDTALIIGTVPTPRARPILEFLSDRLHLIDPTQIRDHKVYYDDLWMAEIVSQTSWRLRSYKTFQLGCNSRFVLGLQS